jgi:predicted ester cyclase
MSEDNKARVRRYFEETLSKGNMSFVDEIADGAMAESLKRGASGLRSAFADMHDQVQDQLAEGDKVVTRFAGGGVHRGVFMGVSPTGKTVTWTGISIDRFVAGKIVERWTQIDVLGVLQQLGAVTLR